MDRNRSYHGIHQALIEGLTMRDISDCMIIGFLRAGDVYSENWHSGDVYKIKNAPSPMIVVKKAMCEILDMQGFRT